MKQREFDDFEIEVSPGGVWLEIYPTNEKFNGKTNFDILEVIVKYMKTKGWVYV